MTEKLFIQLSDDTRDDLFDAAEHLSWRLPNETVRFIAREAIMSAHELSQIPEAELTDNQAYLLEILDDLLKQSGAAYRYILKPAAKSETRDADVAGVKPKRALSCFNCARSVYCEKYNFDNPELQAAKCLGFKAKKEGDQQ